MKCFLKKKILYPIIGTLAFVLTFMILFGNSINVYADTSYNYSVSDINFKTASADGYFTISKANGSHDGKTGKISYYMSANSSISFTFTPTNKIITSVSTFNFYGEYDIDDYGTMAAKSVTYSYFFGSYTSTSENITSEYTFSVDQDQLNAQKPGSITFIITANEVLQLRVGGNFAFNAKDANVDITFNAQGGSGGTSSIKATPGNSMPSISLPTKTGYTFGGYYTATNGGGTKYYNADGTSARSCPSNALTLYAKWTANSYNITYKDQGNVNFSGTHVSGYPTKHTYGTATTLKTATKTGYDFGGWFTNSNCTGSAVTSLGATTYTSNITLYAKWVAKTYIVTLNKQDGTGGTNSVTATYDSSMPTITSLPTKQYYDFIGYYDSATNGTKYYNADGSSARTWNKTSNTTLYAQWKINSDGVIALINDIGDVEYTSTSKELIDVANDAYDSLDSTQKLMVTNYDTLVQANTDYDNVDESIAKVNAIGGVVYTPECKALIDAARDTYDALSDYQKSIYPEDILQKLIDAEKIYEAMDKIDAIKDVENTEEYRELVEDAREYFEALDANQQEKVLNTKDLTDRENVVDFMDLVNAIGNPEDTEEYRDKVEVARDYYDSEMKLDQIALIPDEVMKELVDDEAAIVVMDLINAIGDVEYTPESKALIDTANTAYDNLTEDQKALVANYQELLDDNEDYDNVDESVAKVNAIGDFEYTPECKALIDDARETYDALSDYQKSIYPEDILKKLIDYEKVYEAMDKINAIGDIENTKDCKDKIVTARKVFDKLTDDQKELVYDDFISTLIDDEKAFDTIEKINKIGDPKYTTGCKDKIDLARETYDALTEDQKELVLNYDVLTKDEADYEAVDKVAKEINNIGDITYNNESKEKIENARKAENALTDDQKKFFPAKESKSLENYEATYVVLEKIYTIGTIEYTHESEAKVTDAKDAYDSLTPEQKKLINKDDLGILNNSVTTYETTSRNYDWLLIICLSISTLSLSFGFAYLVSLFINKSKRTGVRTMSVAPFGLLILTSHFTDPIFIALYIIAAAAVFVWLIISVVLMIRRNKK